MTTTIGNANNYEAVIYDNATIGSSTYIWYMKPEDLQLAYSNPETQKYVIEQDNNLVLQLGKQVASFTLKNIPIQAGVSGSIAYGYTTDTIASGQGTAALTMTTASTIALNALAGLQCTINGVNYTIASNTATAGAVVVITLTGNSAADVNAKSLTILTAFAEFQKLKQAMMYWSSGNSGANAYGGYLLYFAAKDTNGNEWSKIPSYNAPTVLTTMRTQIIDPLLIFPKPNGDFLVKEMKVSNFKAIEDVA